MGKAPEYGEDAKVKGENHPPLSSFLPFFRVRAFSISRARLSRSLEQAISLQFTPNALSW